MSWEVFGVKSIYAEIVGGDEVYPTINKGFGTAL